ncbi:MAG: MBL fold metallo-hydrolase [Desulfobulbales bacterium]|nr:MBL fold metallo-hydrolase [Desulfobulbales bacterium]
MTKGLKLGAFEIFWLDGGVFELDGGCMFGVVPRALWGKKFPCTDDYHVKLANTPILVRTPAADLIIDSGLGNKLTAKQKKIFRVTGEWDVEGSLARIGLGREEIDHVILTHCDFDHAGGVVMRNRAGGLELTWPNAAHHLQRAEWQDVVSPNRRSGEAYWPINLDLLGGHSLLNLVDGEAEPVPGIKLLPTGGHTRGHQAVRLSSEGEKAVHLGDLLPNHAGFNPLWITPYDNFPLASIARKEELIAAAAAEAQWFLFYHDPYMSACKIDRDGNVLERFMPTEGDRSELTRH